MAQNTSRLALDLDEIERQLRQSRPASPPENDPLAELARIVGQDDPFRTILSGERPSARRAQAHENPYETASGAPDGAYAPYAAPQQAFEQALWEEAQGAQPAFRHSPDAAAYPSTDYEAEDPAYANALHDLRTVERTRSRKGFVTLGLVLGLGVLGVCGALFVRSGPTLTATGEPPIIKADREPLKVRPENPGGVDVPDQNKQIYERGAPDAQTKVVNREEQPLDVQQVARGLPAPPAATAPPARSAASAKSGPSAGPTVTIVSTAPAPLVAPAPLPISASAALGEPRRVRTVTVRADGTIVQPNHQPSPPPAPTASGRAVAAQPPAAAPVQAAVPSQRARAEAVQPAETTPEPVKTARAPATEARQESGPLQITPSLARPAPDAARPQRTASIAPVAAQDAAPETTSALRGFSVQLAVGSTENDARTHAQSLRHRFAGDLGGRTPIVRRAEVNGKTLYRIRVEPLSRDEANTMCTKVRASGGQCFIARN